MHVSAWIALSVLSVVEAPVTEATVYGDRARVVRTATVPVSGTVDVELPLIEESVDLSSLRVEAEGATVQRVRTERASAADFPDSDARRLLTELEKLDEQIARAQSQRDSYAQQLARLDQLTPTKREGNPLQPPQKLDPAGWTPVTEFVSARQADLSQRIRERDTSLRNLVQQRQRKAEEARIAGGAGQQSGWRVTVTLGGKGNATVRTHYLVPRARWAPTYELQLDPEKNQVEVAFYGLVSQETGTDWKNAALTLSTASPATATRLPKLLTWKIGVRDRFIPTPAPMFEQVKPPPAAARVRSEQQQEALERRRLLAELQQRAASAPGTALNAFAYLDAQSAHQAAQPPPPPPAPPQAQRPRPVQRAPSRSADRGGNAPAAASSMPENEYVVEGTDPSDPGYGLNGTNLAESIAGGAVRSWESLAEVVPGADSDSYGVSVSSSTARMDGRGLAQARMPTAAVGLSPPPSYRPPPIDPRSPAGLAGGYDLAFTSARREAVESGKGARKIALFSETWPVKLERKLFPAMAPYAFLVAELQSPSRQVMPAGDAKLFVGQDPAGEARLELIRPGEKYTLPLGVDRAIKPIRNVELVQSEKGFIGKDDVGRYVVTIEVANPYKQPLPVRILDQWPLRGNEKVEVKLDKVEPTPAQKDDAKGTLEWALTLPPNGKSRVSFTYTLTRPKDWRMEQRQEAGR